MTISQGRLDWSKNYGKKQETLTNANQVFKPTEKKLKTKKARWEDRNAIDLQEVRAKLRKIQKES